MEKSQEIDKKETIKDKVDNLIKSPMSENDFNKQVKSGVASKKGSVIFLDRNEFVEALTYAQSRLPWLSDSWIDYTIKHEDEHINEAKKRLGERGEYRYKLQAIQMENGNLGLAGGYEVIVKYIHKTTMDEHALAIQKAPTELSESDAISTGNVDYK